MEANWDWIISAVIILALILSVWAKISKQTIPELIGDIIDRIKGKTEDSTEYVQEVMTYD